MPPIRAVPPVKPIRTERTHEENQERAYIAASRRSDRSLEARVESARRASEIHKKRTGRSLRVREEDVINEEMYEEEDDDLPMQFRRINALHPGLAFNPAFSERVNSYLAGQIGVRNYLHQAIFHANQSQYNNHLFSPIMHHNAFQNGTVSPQSTTSALNGQPWSMPNAQAGSSVTAPQQPNDEGNAPAALDTRRSSNVVASPAPLSHTPTQHPHSQHQPGQHQQSPMSSSGHIAAPDPTRAREQSPLYPLTTKLPIETQQLIDGQPAFMNAVSPSQLTAGIPMPSMGMYPYSSNGKAAVDLPHAVTGLDQTLSWGMPHARSNPSPLAESQPVDFGFDDMYKFDDDDFGFDVKYEDGATPGNAQNGAHLTPSEINWNDTDFFNYTAASD